jgi:hypothetical protein
VPLQIQQHRRTRPSLVPLPPVGNRQGESGQQDIVHLTMEKSRDLSQQGSRHFCRQSQAQTARTGRSILSRINRTNRQQRIGCAENLLLKSCHTGKLITALQPGPDSRFFNTTLPE